MESRTKSSAAVTSHSSLSPGERRTLYEPPLLLLLLAAALTLVSRLHDSQQKKETRDGKKVSETVKERNREEEPK